MRVSSEFKIYRAYMSGTVDKKMNDFNSSDQQKRQLDTCTQVLQDSVRA